MTCGAASTAQGWLRARVQLAGPGSGGGVERDPRARSNTTVWGRRKRLEKAAAMLRTVYSKRGDMMEPQGPFGLGQETKASRAPKGA